MVGGFSVRVLGRDTQRLPPARQKPIGEFVYERLRLFDAPACTCAGLAEIASSVELKEARQVNWRFSLVCSVKGLGGGNAIDQCGHGIDNAHYIRARW